MSIEINRVRASGEGVTFEVFVPNLSAFVRIADTILKTEPRAFSAAEDLEQRRRAAEVATDRRIPRASMPPYVTAQDEPPLRSLEDGPEKAGLTD